MPTNKRSLANSWVGVVISLGICVCIYFVFGLIGLYLTKYFTVVGGTRVEMWWLWVVSIAIYSYLSFNTGGPIGQSEQANKLFLGVPIQQIPSGRFFFAPLGFFTINRIDFEKQQVELPGEPEEIWNLRDADDNILPVGYGKDGKPIDPPKGKKWVAPILVNFDDNSLCIDLDPLHQFAGEFKETPATMMKNGERNDSKKESEDPTTKRLTTGVPFNLTVRVREMDAFFRSYETLENAIKLLSDTAVSLATGVLQQGTLARALANQILVGRYITKKLREHVEQTGEGEDGKYPQGIEIVSFQMKQPALSHSLNKKIQGVAEAVAEAASTRRIGKAKAEVVQVMLEAKAAGKLADLKADADGLALMLAQFMQTPEAAGLIFRLRATVASLEKNSKFVITQGEKPFDGFLADAMSKIEGIKQEMKNLPAPAAAPVPVGSTPP